MTADNAPLDADAQTSGSLLERVKSRDGLAWERLAALYGPLVYGWARKKGLRDADASDVVQDVFQAVARQIDAFRRDRAGDSFRGWLWTITRHRIADHFRRVASSPVAMGGSDVREQMEQLADSIDASECNHSPGEQSLLMRQALELVRGEFEARTFQAFWRIAVEGESPADVAKAMQMGVWAVYQAKSRVLRRLRSEFAELM
jgi:RNA polymerase sigma-70 factor (ECF subfamily)